MKVKEKQEYIFQAEYKSGIKEKLDQALDNYLPDYVGNSAIIVSVQLVEIL